MTHTLVLAGADHRVLADHLAAIGLGSILESVLGGEAVGVNWTGGVSPSPAVHTPVTADEIASVVADHAGRQAWMDADFPDANGEHRALMSPRRGVSTEWFAALVQARRVLIDQCAGNDVLTARFFGGLGELSHWHLDQKGNSQTDYGASRLDVQPRNRGSELITNRLRTLRQIVANATVEEVCAGLGGSAVRLEPDAASGLAPPGPYSPIRAWCAFWAMAALPVAPRAPARSATSAVKGVRPPVVVMPVWDRPLRMAALRRVLTWAALTEPLGEDVRSRDTAAALLADQGVRAVVAFRLVNRGTSKAAKWVADLGEVTVTDPFNGR